MSSLIVCLGVDLNTLGFVLPFPLSSNMDFDSDDRLTFT